MADGRWDKTCVPFVMEQQRAHVCVRVVSKKKEMTLVYPPITNHQPVTGVCGAWIDENTWCQHQGMIGHKRAYSRELAQDVLPLINEIEKAGRREMCIRVITINQLGLLSL